MTNVKVLAIILLTICFESSKCRAKIIKNDLYSCYEKKKKSYLYSVNYYSYLCKVI